MIKIINKESENLVRETVITVADFIYPLFVVEGSDIKEEISSIPGTFHYSVGRLPEIISEIKASSVREVILFGIPDYKDEIASSDFAKDGIVQLLLIMQ